jgi:hypothetical protein
MMYRRILPHHLCLSAFGLLALFLTGLPARAAAPAWLPHYDLDVQLDVPNHLARVRQRIVWINYHTRPADSLVFNAHAHYKLPDKDVGMTAKIFEILRMMPSEVLDFEGHSLDVQRVWLVEPPPTVLPAAARSSGRDGDAQLPPPRLLPPGGEEDMLPAPRPLPPAPPVQPAPFLPKLRPLKFHYDDKNDTALVVPLPRTVARGESVTVELEFVLKLPNVEGRWGYWEGVTYLTNCLPVLAYYDESGWRPTPYVPWHQPFFNEAGLWTVRLTVAADQKVACTAGVREEHDLPGGLKQIDYAPCYARDFSLLCSARFKEFTGQAGPVRVRCLAFPEHEFYARFAVQSACDAITAFVRWFGPFPYPHFTIVESYFGWNSNECAGLVMLDARIFNMAHLAQNFVDYLVAHETFHQWWYNVVGTNGFAETWMDEGPATYFAYRLMRIKHGVNDPLVKYPGLLKWMPNVHRNDYRYFNLYGTLARGEAMPTVQELPKYGHIVDMYSMCYERGSKVIGMLEYCMGEQAFFDFWHRVYARYEWRILQVADFRHELEDYTRGSWAEFFNKWVYGKGMVDWRVDKVKIQRLERWQCRNPPPLPPQVPRVRRWLHPHAADPCRVTVELSQHAEYNEATVVGFCLDGGENYQVRVPVYPQAGHYELDDPPMRLERLAANRVRIEVDLPCQPTQVAVDPDQVLVDVNPINNVWKQHYNVRLTPVYTFLDETDLTNAYDRWNIILGPWLFAPTYDNPWFTRSTRVGVRVGAYRTARFEGGAYAAYRTDYRDFVTGIDGVLDHWPWAHTEVGYVFERRLVGTLRGEQQANRGVLYGRYVIDYGDSLYLPPFQYVEAFSTIQDNLLPFARESLPGAERFKHQAVAGGHYHINYLTPYWDPEGGFSCDLSYVAGVQVPGEPSSSPSSNQQVTGQFTYVQAMPDGLGWLSDTKWAFRIYGAAGLPSRVQYFALGGGELFRGFDLAQRQGSRLWVGSVEWRMPVAQHLTWSFCDHALGLHAIWCAAFCDVGDVYLFNRSVGGVAEAAGLGLRLDVSWFTFVERTIVRFDAAKTVNANTGPQFWFGIEHPF